ncbi:hypothetical protein [Actinomadura rupiterrae]|uniref:hypothetical protein n=1 Tax=Actinomadura rupiterrae TaxID=559627 RepID=UPI0020A4B574|nr:hypothetical protein [Actinomadura rupiterrae]MCP2343707.1 hypothetical protein [Actinomadura rupiterrae]
MAKSNVEGKYVMSHRLPCWAAVGTIIAASTTAAPATAWSAPSLQRPNTPSASGAGTVQATPLAKRRALLKRLIELRPANPYRPAYLRTRTYNLGHDCIGLLEGPYPGGGRVWAEAETACASGNPGAEVKSKLIRSGVQVDYMRDTGGNFAYAVNSVACSGNKHYRHDYVLRAGVYSWQYYDALYINC